MATDGNAKYKGKEIMAESQIDLLNIKFTNSRYFPNGFRVLVVDGCPMYRRIAKAYCGLCDYKATTVSSTTEAITKLHETQGGFDLVLSEVYMEGIDGFTLLDTVKREFKISVILMSPDGRLETMARGLQEGACFFLEKPFGLPEIQQIWQHCVVYHVRTNKKLSSGLSSKQVESTENLEENDIEITNTLNDGNMIWTTELYLEFLSATEVVSLFAEPEPENVYQCMRNRGITTISKDNVASLLQLLKGGDDDDTDEEESESDDDDSEEVESDYQVIKAGYDDDNDKEELNGDDDDTGAV